MSEPFRFSHRENDAASIRWRHWGPEAFREATESESLLFLNLTATWCGACHDMDEGPLSDSAVIELLNERVVPVRVDGDRLPHVQDRYIAGGWPTNAILTPTGEVFWAGTYVDAGELRQVVGDVLDAWRDRRDELNVEIERRRKAMEAARSRRPAIGIVRREAADDVLSGAQDQFDARNGGFGDAPKFIHAEAVELLFTQAERLSNPDWAAMAERTLDGMLAGDIEDPVEGGFFHYALAADWTEPQMEKLLSVNARVLRGFAFGAARTGRTDWLEAAERTVAWAESTLRRQDGLWFGSQAADSAYFSAPDRSGAPPVDDTVYAHSCGMWIAALADAGRWLDRPEWVERAREALGTLLKAMEEENDALRHYDAPDGEPPVGLLLDMVHVATAALAVAETGDDAALDHASRLAECMEDTLWDDRGGFLDYPPRRDPPGALRYRDRPFEENALASRLFLALATRTGKRTYRAIAERTLALLSPLAGRYAVEGATFAMAVEEFFRLRKG
ncbi:MAG TPA: DUF255 domain-containing protein [Longimicrobiales bacterium]|nr:DUF255 domain-containing protein [Longimicrobiales bacterium]